MQAGGVAEPALSAMAAAAEWNFTDVWETIAGAVPDRVVQVHGERAILWRDFDRRAAGIAAALVRAGLRPQDKVALYLKSGRLCSVGVDPVRRADTTPIRGDGLIWARSLTARTDRLRAVLRRSNGEFDLRVAGGVGRQPAIRRCRVLEMQGNEAWRKLGGPSRSP